MVDVDSRLAVGFLGFGRLGDEIRAVENLEVFGSIGLLLWELRRV